MTTNFDPGGIRIEGSGPKEEAYEEAVLEQLNSILKNPIGHALLDFIDADAHYIYVKPIKDGGCGEDGVESAKDRDASPEGVTPYLGYGDGTERYINADGRLTISRRTDQANWKGTGNGTDVYVRFSPDCHGGKFGSQPDEVLMHELVHGYRRMAAKFNPIPVEQMLNSYMNEEEWLAIFITNIYIALKDGHNNNLRADHFGHERLKPPLNSSRGFLRNDGHLKLVRKYIGEHPDLFFRLSVFYASYNPIAEYLNNKR